MIDFGLPITTTTEVEGLTQVEGLGAALLHAAAAAGSFALAIARPIVSLPESYAKAYTMVFTNLQPGTAAPREEERY